MKLCSFISGLFMSMIAFSSCQNGEKVVSMIDYEGKECIETFYVKTEIIEGDTVKTPCGKHKIETKDGILLSEWNDKYDAPNSCYVTGKRKKYEIGMSYKGEELHYISLEETFNRKGTLTEENYYKLGDNKYLSKSIKYNDSGNDDWHNVTKIYHANGKLASEIKYQLGMSRESIISSKYYDSDGDRIKEIDRFNQLLGFQNVFATVSDNMQWCLIFFSKNENEGKVTLVPFTLDLKRYYEDRSLVYRYSIKNNKIHLYDGAKVVTYRGDNSSPEDTDFIMYFTENGDIQLEGHINGTLNPFELTRVNFSLNQHNYKY